MPTRATLLTSGLCFAGAVLLALLAMGAFLSGEFAAGWWLIAGGGIIALAGVQVHRTFLEETAALRDAFSEARLLESELSRQRRAVDALADGLDVAIFLCDKSANILYANRRAATIFNFQEPIGRSLLAVTLSSELEQLVLDSAGRQETAHAEIAFNAPAERIGICKAWIAEHDTARVFLSIYEVTDLRHLERVRQDFVANVSHELRTPLTIIRAKAENLLDEASAANQAPLVAIIEEVDRLAMITQDLLVLSTAESLPVRRQTTDLAGVAKRVLSQLSEKADRRAIALAYEGPEKLFVEANKSQMMQVVLNLADNAISYTASGEVTIRLGRDDDDDAVLEVADTGIGISSEHMPRIFERFYRVDKARSRSAGGTGLGLSIVKHIVEAHGGTVDVDSALNRGSTFTVRLPIGSPSASEPNS